MFEVVSHAHIAVGLGSASEPNARSVFDRLGMEQERRLTTNSHSFRHFLSDLALRGGMSEDDLAMWSCRRFVMANRAYDHISGADIRAVAATVDVAGFLLGGKRRPKA